MKVALSVNFTAAAAFHAPVVLKFFATFPVPHDGAVETPPHVFWSVSQQVVVHFASSVTEVVAATAAFLIINGVPPAAQLTPAHVTVGMVSQQLVRASADVAPATSRIVDKLLRFPVPQKVLLAWCVLRHVAAVLALQHVVKHLGLLAAPALLHFVVPAATLSYAICEQPQPMVALHPKVSSSFSGHVTANPVSTCDVKITKIISEAEAMVLRAERCGEHVATGPSESPKIT